jgi:hypothetical protein
VNDPWGLGKDREDHRRQWQQLWLLDSIKDVSDLLACGAVNARIGHAPTLRMPAKNFTPRAALKQWPNTADGRCSNHTPRFAVAMSRIEAATECFYFI